MKKAEIGEALQILSEECSEVIKECCKCMRFGILNHNPLDETETTNIKRLEDEIGHVLFAIEIMNSKGYINMDNVEYSFRKKKETIKKYLYNLEIKDA